MNLLALAAGCIWLFSFLWALEKCMEARKLAEFYRKEFLFVIGGPEYAGNKAKALPWEVKP